jgi:hypothetical protein
VYRCWGEHASCPLGPGIALSGPESRIQKSFVDSLLISCNACFTGNLALRRHAIGESFKFGDKWSKFDLRHNFLCIMSFNGFAQSCNKLCPQFGFPLFFRRFFTSFSHGFR